MTNYFRKEMSSTITLHHNQFAVEKDKGDIEYSGDIVYGDGPLKILSHLVYVDSARQFGSPF